MASSTLRIAWRNLWRNGKRTLLAVLAIAVGQWALLATRGMMRGYADNIQNAITGPMLGHLQVHHPHYRDERALELVLPQVTAKLSAIRALSIVADAAPRIYAPVLCAPKQDAFIATVVGIDLDSESKPQGLLTGYTAGLPPHQVLIGYRLARTMKATVGQEVAVVGQAIDGSTANDLYTVAGIIEGPDDLVNQAGIVMRLTDAQELLAMQDSAHEIVIRARHAEDVPRLQAELRMLPALVGLEVIEWRELMPEMVLVME
ncbi:MAG TPA: ABC transporter permease, partial [Planctomycetota bacterium]|nr:ABC transporter permease [Planctomycetota bacterium]